MISILFEIERIIFLRTKHNTLTKLSLELQSKCPLKLTYYKKCPLQIRDYGKIQKNTKRNLCLLLFEIF
jgi:hypothetical protein